MKYYYDNGWSYDVFSLYSSYVLAYIKSYYVWSLESLEKHHKLLFSNPGECITEFMWANDNKKYITQNDCWEITAKEYLNVIREKKLKRILK